MLTRFVGYLLRLRLALTRAGALRAGVARCEECLLGRAVITALLRATDATGNPTTVIRDVTVNPQVTYYCYDGSGNMAARLACPLGDCAARCP